MKSLSPALRALILPLHPALNWEKLRLRNGNSKNTPGVESARRALQILLMFAEDRLNLTVDEVAKLYDISLPSAYRYMSLLRELHLVREGRHGAFVLTPRVLELAAAAERSIDLERAAQPVLDRLMTETGETAFILKRVRNEAVFVLSAQPDRALSISYRAGNTMPPLHTGAVAKVLLAYAPAQFRQNYLAKTIANAKEREYLAQKLDAIRASGFAESEAEVDEGIWGGAVPIRVGDAVVASLSVAGPAFRLDRKKRQAIRKLLTAAADEIATAITGE